METGRMKKRVTQGEKTSLFRLKYHRVSKLVRDKTGKKKRRDNVGGASSEVGKGKQKRIHGQGGFSGPAVKKLQKKLSRGEAREIQQYTKSFKIPAVQPPMGKLNPSTKQREGQISKEG